MIILNTYDLYYSHISVITVLIYVIKNCLKPFSTITPPPPSPITHYFKGIIWVVVIGVIIFDISCLQDECMNEVGQRYIKIIRIVVRSVVFK